jgi:hypothetical protein
VRLTAEWSTRLLYKTVSIGITVLETLAMVSVVMNEATRVRGRGDRIHSRGDVRRKLCANWWTVGSGHEKRT